MSLCSRSKRFPGDRHSAETDWVDIAGALLAHGYQLRPRFRPDWVPSWFPMLEELERNRRPFYWEAFPDGLSFLEWNVMDAVRVDGLPVILKLIYGDDQNSIPYAVYFCHEPLRSDSRNHCAPLLDVIPVPQDSFPGFAALVLPRYLDWDIWPFVQVGEVVDFLAQMFEGLAFMHEHHAAHLDISHANIAMDGLHLFKEPYHPAKPKLRADVKGDAQHWERFESKQPVKYYFIDFDQSVRFANADEIRPVSRDKGQVVQAPELYTPPYDAFKLDIFCLGHVIITHILNAYENVEFVRPIVVDMLHPDPAQRPTAQQVVSRFAEIRRTLFRPELEASPGFIPSYHWITYYAGETPAREPPRMRRASFSGTRSQTPLSSHTRSQSILL